MRIFVLLSVLAWAVVQAVPAGAEVDRRTANSDNVVLEDIPPVPVEISQALKRYQNARSASFVDWSEDGRSIYIRTRFAEVTQFHRVDAPGGARHQLSWFDEPVGQATRQPGSDILAFLMDEGGSEFSQIFLFDPAEGTYTMISDGQSRNGGLRWSRDGRFLAFSSTRRDGRSNDVWMMDIHTGTEPRMVLESTDGSGWGAVEFSPDGAALLIQQFISVNDSRIHLLDLESGEIKAIAGSAENPARNLAYGFSADGQGIYFGTSAEGEFTELAYLSLEPGAEARILTSDIEWSVTSFELHPNGESAAFLTNEEGIGRLYRLDTRTGDYKPIENVPEGLLGSLNFSPDGKRLAMIINNPRSPSDIHVLEWGSHDLNRWTYSEVGGLDTEQFVMPELIHYPTFDEVDGVPRRIPAFVYRPESEGPHPVIIQIHGGPEAQSRPSFSSTYQLWIDYLDVAVVRPNVRGSSGYGKTYLDLDNAYKREDSVRDIGALLDWIANQPDLDENRVAVYGGSYGGYMVLASAVHYSDRLSAAVNIVGISNFVTFLENTEAYRRDLRRVEYGDERDPDMRAHLEKISPLNNVEKIDVPMFVAHGQNDPRVPVSEAEQIVTALREQDTAVWYMNALNEGHGFRRKENRDLFLEVTVMFFREYLLE